MEPVATGLDVFLQVQGTRPAHDLEHAIRDAIADGRLVTGTRLPASRTLAGDLGIARNTVAEAYNRLVEEGWLAARVGAGTWVAGGATAIPEERVESGGERLDLRGGLADASDFPRAEWASATRRALSEADSAAFGYRDALGVRELRGCMAAYLARTRGVVAASSDLVIGQGFGDLLRLFARVLVERGVRRIAVESFGHERHRRLLREAGLQLVPIPVDRFGADVSALDGTIGAVLLTPAHQFPIGVPLSAERRRAVLEWASKYDAYVLEDDYDGEFRYDRRSVGALQGLDPTRTVYFGSASKALAPAIGLGWAVLPDSLYAAVQAMRTVDGIAPSTVQQLALARFVDTHEYDRSVRRRRSAFRTRRQYLAGLIARSGLPVTIDGLDAGLQCVVTLPDADTEARVVAAAGRRGVVLDGLANFRAPESAEHDARNAGVVVGYGAVPMMRANEAMDLVVESLAEGLHASA